jgi:hypothetical protein
MAETSKFAGALANIRKPKVEAPAGEPPIAPVEPIGRRGRPLGKSSHPKYRVTTVILQRQTLKNARRKLDDLDVSDVDMSDVMDRLLTAWVEGRIEVALTMAEV